MGRVCIRNYGKKCFFDCKRTFSLVCTLFDRKKALKNLLLSFKGWNLSQTFRIRYLIDLSNLQTDILIYIRKHHVFVCVSLYLGQISAMIFIFMVWKWFDQIHYKKMPGLLYAVSLLWYCRCDLLHEAYTLELHIAIWFL